MKYKYLFIVGCLLVVALALLREWMDGGVYVHHILQRKDMPGISNWWGLPVMAVLSFICIGRIEKHLLAVSESQRSRVSRTAVYKFLLAAAFGIILSVCFTYKVDLFLENVLYLLIALAVFFPLYHGEYILGFVLGMTVTFGAILPTAFALVIGGVSLILHVLAYKKLLAKFRANG